MCPYFTSWWLYIVQLHNSCTIGWQVFYIFDNSVQFTVTLMIAQVDNTHNTQWLRERAACLLCDYMHIAQELWLDCNGCTCWLQYTLLPLDYDGLVDDMHIAQELYVTNVEHHVHNMRWCPVLYVGCIIMVGWVGGVSPFICSPPTLTHSTLPKSLHHHHHHGHQRHPPHPSHHHHRCSEAINGSDYWHHIQVASIVAYWHNRWCQ